MPLLRFQRNNLKKISEELLLNTQLRVIGKKNSGRRYTLEHIQGDYLIVSVKNPSKENSLSPIFNALNYFRDELSERNIHFSWGISGTILFLGLDFNSYDFNEQEKKLEQAVAHLRRKNPVLFIFDSDELTDVLRHFIKQIVEAKFYFRRKPLKIIYLSDRHKTNSNIKEVLFETLDYTENKQQILHDLGLRGNIVLSEEEVNFILNITQSNIKELVGIIDNLNNAELSFAECRDERNSIIMLLNKCFENKNIQEIMPQILAYCAYSDDFTLSKSDLNFLLNINMFDLSDCLKYAQEFTLVELVNDKIYIIISLLKKIYKQQFSMRKGEIYANLCEMIAHLYPSNYKQKYIYALCASDNNKDIYYCQYFMQQIRTHGSYGQCADEKDFKYKDLLDTYRMAYYYIVKRDYKEAASKISVYMELPAPLRAEVTLLLAQVYMKSLESKRRGQALDLIKSIDKKTLDIYLKYRVTMFEVVSNIHMGNYNEAYRLYNNLLDNLVDMRLKHQSRELDELYFSLLRKNNMVNNYQSSVPFIEQSKAYYKKMVDMPVAYYLAITNSLGIHVKNMDLNAAKEDVNDMQDLKTKYLMFNFPREYIYENNYLIYLYLCDKTQVHYIVERFQSLMNSMSNFADKYLVANNFAVFMALDGKIRDALDELRQLYRGIQNEDEGIYLYKYIVNSSIMEYILNNSERDHLIAKISKIKLPQGYPNKNALENETKLIIQNMQHDCDTVAQWLKNYDALLPQYRSRNSFELGFVITELFSWDDG